MLRRHEVVFGIAADLHSRSHCHLIGGCDSPFRTHLDDGVLLHTVLLISTGTFLSRPTLTQGRTIGRSGPNCACIRCCSFLTVMMRRLREGFIARVEIWTDAKINFIKIIGYLD